MEQQQQQEFTNYREPNESPKKEITSNPGIGNTIMNDGMGGTAAIEDDDQDDPLA